LESLDFPLRDPEPSDDLEPEPLDVLLEDLDTLCEGLRERAIFGAF
jgi:hypothetical protein